MALLIKVAFSIASFVCRNDSKKIAVIDFIETLLAVLLTVLTILFKVESCCGKRSNEKNENDENDENNEVKIIKKGKDFLGSLMKYSFVLEKLKKITDKNREAGILLNEIKQAVKDFITN